VLLIESSGAISKMSTKSSLPALSSLIGKVSSEAAKRLLILSGLTASTSKEDVEKLAGNAKLVRQLHFPVACDSGDLAPCAAILYRGKRDALKAVARLNAQKSGGLQLNVFTFGKLHVWREDFL
jgi:hypothetical protein